MDGPSLKPQKISDCSWYYECTTHMQILHEVQCGGKTVCERIFIPWRMVKKSMDRSYKPRKRRARLT
jgi:hypothetical protein